MDANDEKVLEPAVVRNDGNQRADALGVPDWGLLAKQAGVIEVAGRHIPLLEVKWADERQWCGRIHRFLTGEVPVSEVAELRADCDMCRALPRDGGEYCALAGGPDDPVPCLFDERRDAEGWRKARRWTLVALEYADGRTERALTPAAWATKAAAEAAAGG